MENRREFRKVGLLMTKFYREHNGASMRARHRTGKGEKWYGCCVHFQGCTVYAPGEYTRIHDFERWAIGEIKRIKQRLDSLYVLWDPSEHLFVVDLPEWSAGIWTQDLEKARKYTAESAKGEQSIYKEGRFKAMTVKEARAMLSKSKYLTRTII